MKKLFAIAILGIAALGLSTPSASAGWLWNCCCKHKCSMTLTAKQYNAFSPYCLDSFNGCFPLQGMAANCCGGGCYIGNTGCGYSGVACLGELPSGTVLNGMTSLPQAGVTAVAPAAPAIQAPTTAQTWPTWAPGMVNPTGVPSYFPTPGAYGQANVTGR